MFVTNEKNKPGKCIRRSMLILSALYPVFASLAIFFFVPSAGAQINCQSEIYLPAKTDPEDRFKKGYCFIQLGQFQEGVSRLSGLESELPVISDYVIYYQGAGYENLGDYANAAEKFNKVIAGYPESGVRIKTLARLGNIYTETGDYPNAERIFRSLYAEESDRDSKASYLESLGQTYEKEGKYMDAVNTYKQVWVEFPETKSSFSAQKAARDISASQGIPFVPTESDYLQRADKLYELSKWSSAAESYEHVTSQSAEVRTRMGIAMVNAGRLNEAESVLSGINSPESLFWRGKLKSKQGLDPEASALYSRIHTQFPSNDLAPEGLYNAGRLYQINDDYQNAIKTYDLLIRTYPQSSFAEEGAWNLGWIYYKRGMYPEALATFSSFTNSPSAFNAANSRYWKARTLEKLGRRDEAMSEYMQLAQMTTPTYQSYLAQRKT